MTMNHEDRNTAARLDQLSARIDANTHAVTSMLEDLVATVAELFEAVAEHQAHLDELTRRLPRDDQGFTEQTRATRAQAQQARLQASRLMERAGTIVSHSLDLRSDAGELQRPRATETRRPASG